MKTAEPSSSMPYQTTMPTSPSDMALRTRRPWRQGTRATGSLAVPSRSAVRKRTTAGLTAARARGRLGGRPKALTARQLNIAQALYNDKQHSIAEICQTLKISKATLYRSIKTGKETNVSVLGSPIQGCIQMNWNSVSATVGILPYSDRTVGCVEYRACRRAPKLNEANL